MIRASLPLSARPAQRFLPHSSRTYVSKRFPVLTTSNPATRPLGSHASATAAGVHPRPAARHNASSICVTPQQQPLMHMKRFLVFISFLAAMYVFPTIAQASQASPTAKVHLPTLFLAAVVPVLKVFLLCSIGALCARKVCATLPGMNILIVPGKDVKRCNKCCGDVHCRVCLLRRGAE